MWIGMVLLLVINFVRYDFRIIDGDCSHVEMENLLRLFMFITAVCALCVLHKGEFCSVFHQSKVNSFCVASPVREDNNFCWKLYIQCSVVAIVEMYSLYTVLQVFVDGIILCTAKQHDYKFLVIPIYCDFNLIF